MKHIATLVLVLSVFFTGCSSISKEQAAIIRTFPVAETGALKAIEKAALAAGYQKVNPYEYHLVVRTKHDPILGLVEVSKQMDVGLGFTVSIESKESSSLVTINPVQIVRVPLTKDQYNRAPLKPGSNDYAAVAAVIESAKARAEF